MFSKDLGYNKEELLNVVALPKQWDTAGIERMKRVRDQLLKMPEVMSASLSFEIPTRKPPGQITLYPEAQKNAGPLVLAAFAADQYYACTFGLQMVAGSFFSPSGAFIPNQVVLNESAAKILGFDQPSSAVGRQLNQPVGNPPLTIAGVARDYHYSSLQQHIEPLVIVHLEDALIYRYLNLKLKTADFQKAVTDIKAKWKELLPEAPFEYFFMDQQFQSPIHLSYS